MQRRYIRRSGLPIVVVHRQNLEHIHTVNRSYQIPPWQVVLQYHDQVYRDHIWQKVAWSVKRGKQKNIDYNQRNQKQFKERTHRGSIFFLLYKKKKISETKVWHPTEGLHKEANLLLPIKDTGKKIIKKKKRRKKEGREKGSYPRDDCSTRIPKLSDTACPKAILIATETFFDCFNIFILLPRIRN